MKITIKSMLKKMSIIAVAALALFALQACEQEGPAERAGESIDNAVDNTKDAVEEAADQVEDQADKLK